MICKVCNKEVEETYIMALTVGKCRKCMGETKGRRVWNEEKGGFINVYKTKCLHCGKITEKKRRGKFCDAYCTRQYMKDNHVGWSK